MKYRWLLLAIVLLAAGAAIGVYSGLGRPLAPAAATPAGGAPAESKSPSGQVRLSSQAQREAGIATVLMTSSDVPDVIRATGKIVMNEDQTWHVGALAGGKVLKVLARVGDVVQEGQVLAYLHSHEVHETRASYQQARADLDRARNAHELAKRMHGRAQRLLALQAVSQEWADQAASDLKAASANVSKAEAGVEKERAHLTEFLEVPVEDAPAGGVTGGQDADAVPVKAPASGLVVSRKVSAGSVLTPGDEAFTITNAGSLWMIAAVNEADLPALRPGQHARISVRAYPQTVFSGRVLQLGEEMDPTTRTLRVRLTLPNPRNLLKPEMFATAEIQRAGHHPALYVPEAASQELNGQRIVFVQSSTETFEPRAVRVAQVVDGQMLIDEGLQAGDRVVIRGSFALKTELLKRTLEGE